ncbi:hypothetical protein [Kitasatospora sp. MBT63]|uniref:hypothetical protein n=1 Tax=Kitasatospora sp. MBT63 TaxID=1444768 RepID=UPI000539E4DD|nr:hypothetical protein [Kitasatospora sp. MBT63]
MTAPAWTDDEIVAEIREIARADRLPPPAPAEAADAFEALTGFPMAPLLRRIYCEAANGGFGPGGGGGPGYRRVEGGVVSLTASKRRFSNESSLLHLYREWTSQPSAEQQYYPRHVLPLVTLGGVIWWCIDLSSPQGSMWGADENACDHHWLAPQNLTLAQWLTDWLRGDPALPVIPPVPGCPTC